MTTRELKSLVSTQCRCPHCGFHVGHDKGMFIDTGKPLKVYLCPRCCKTSTFELTAKKPVTGKVQHISPAVPAVKPADRE